MTINKISSWSKLLMLSVILTTACTDSFEGYNTNKHQVTEETMSYDDLKIGSFFLQMQKNVVMYDEKAGEENGNITSDYQVAQGLTSDLFSGYIAPTLGNGSQNNGSYYFINGWIEQSFTKPMQKVMSPWLNLVKEAETQERPQAIAVATIVKVEAMHRVADAYGPIPYVNFDGSAENEYDALDVVYSKFFEELDESIEILTEFVNANPSSTVLPNYDNIYYGDATKWVKFANTLRLRLAMRIVYANATLAKTEAEKSVNHPFGFISAKGERASLKHSSNLIYYHPLYEIARLFNAATDNLVYGDCQPGATVDAYMNGYEDPRRAAYLTRATLDDGYHGVRCGIPTTVWDIYKNHRYISSLNMDDSNTEIVWMTAAESYFLRAEGAYRGWSMGGSAQSFYEQGITVSFEENSVQGADSYITDATRQPIAFTDNADGSSYNAPQPSTITIAWDDSASSEEKLERIITQKWIAMFPDGPEGWAEFRRTGYPKIIPVVTNNSGGVINTNTQVRRIPYPQSEYDKNKAGLQVGISKLGGQDNGGTKLWWDKK
ncbi:hypothetical protein GGR21_004223 [Dysgonomonas hofstadii]|uniref:Susd and RagB outer membrane lipoprotein n=1 Tax=Dysgonomonas hofstadii TaxID=637886 RepID=A0A840CTF3_9BACT|nr:RagB/SusD family nutrient uptake outer membrane protein [Dysgonomonas hofstadii]MBB4038291.1 hypothetical protein [Dysgonomonas hofstadii]